MADAIAHILDRFELAKAKRAPFDGDWNSIRDFVRPISVAFNQTTGQFVSVRPETMFDGTACAALEELASALHTYMTNPAERWFELQIEGSHATALEFDELEWLEQATNTIYAAYHREDCNLNGSLHEAYMDLGSFGAATISQEWDRDMDGIIFQAQPLAHSYIFENSKGRVDSLFRQMTWSIRQVKQEFGSVLPPKLMQIKGDDKPVEVLHCVYPRTDRVPGMSPTRMPFASIWICLTTKEILMESGYETFPYHVPRWTKLAGEFYGRSPARKCLPDIKMLNAMEKTILKAGQKRVDPPLVLANEGFLLPIRTSPGSLIFKEDEERTVTPLEFKGDMPWAEDKAMQKREFIRQCFYNDLIRREKKKREQSATEVMDDRDEMLRLFAPTFGRLTMELLGPMISRSYNLLKQHNRIPPAPESLSSRKLTIGYTSPAAKAQLNAAASQMSQYLQDLIPLAQINPDILDAVDMDKLAEQLAIARGTPRSILRSPEELAKLREAKKQMQAMQQAAQIAEPAANAMKNIAQAQTLGGGM